MKKVYGVMLIGCGHIGEEHISDIYYRENIQISAVVDSSYERAEIFSKKYNARKFGTDYREFLKDADVDIVIVATYTDSHFSILTDCIKAGKNVLCEKPIACNLDDGLKFYKAVKNSDSKVLVAHILRHNRSYQKMAEIIHSGVIGELKLIRMVQNHHTKNWERYKRLLTDCSSLVDCGVHYIDVMQWFTKSKVCEVSGISAKLDEDAPRDNFGMMQVKLENGCIGYYEVAWSKNSSSQNLKEFIGTKGRITFELAENRFRDKEEGDLISIYHSDTNTYETVNCNSKYKDMYKQISHLIHMIENNIDANPDIDEVFSSFYVAMKADSVIKEKKTAKINVEEFLANALNDD